jgi:autotransporter-associated beta strand protein
VVNAATLQCVVGTLNRDLNLNNGSTLAFANFVTQSNGIHTVASGAGVTFALKSLSVNPVLGDGLNDLTGGGGGSSILVTSDTAGAVLTLNQRSNYSGTFIIGTGATVAIDGDDSLGNPANVVVLSIGTLRTTQSFTTSRAFQAEFGTFEVINGSTLTMAGGIGTGANPATKSGDGTLVLAADSARTGGLTINGGTVVAQTTGALGGTGIHRYPSTTPVRWKLMTSPSASSLD